MTHARQQPLPVRARNIRGKVCVECCIVQDRRNGRYGRIGKVGVWKLGPALARLPAAPFLSCLVLAGAGVSMHMRETLQGPAAVELARDRLEYADAWTTTSARYHCAVRDGHRALAA